MARDLGDFQTPPELVAAVCACLGRDGRQWERALEPTCGVGNFIAGLLRITPPLREIQGIEIQAAHLEVARTRVDVVAHPHITLREANIFDVNLGQDLIWHGDGPLLVVGNPPWVTNAVLGSLESQNLPRKANIRNLRGIDALTGKSNFDLAESIWLKLITELAGASPTIALLCKTSVARNIMQHAYERGLPIAHASLYRIDAHKWFRAAVDACLFVVETGPQDWHYEASVYADLDASAVDSVVGVVAGRLVADVAGYTSVAFLDGTCLLNWRQGVKHDAAQVMELTQDALGCFRTKQGESVAIEADYLYPLLKSSDVFRLDSMQTQRRVIVTQRQLGEDTRQLQYTAPQLWAYLHAHRDHFFARKSSIYRNQPPFAMFGIGDYAFAPYKVAISGLYKSPRFQAIGPVAGRPVMLDDTCYFLPAASAQQAALLVSLLNHPLCLAFLQALTFQDAKRPITKSLLQRIDLLALLRAVERQPLLQCASNELERLGVMEKDHSIWPMTLEVLLQAPVSDPEGPVQLKFGFDS